jgi:anti-anti-sigma factor
MQLTFESRRAENVVVIRCRGRITFGPEAEGLEAEVERQTKIPGSSAWRVRNVVLDLGETEYLDSSGLGMLVRLFTLLRAAGGAEQGK